MKRMLSTIGATLLLAGAALAQTATLTLTSPQAGQTIAAGATVTWTISATVSTGDNLGLALVVTDLVQAPANPQLLDLPYATAGTIPGTLSGFNRPGGITNPGEGGNPSGYVGVQRGTAGQKNLIQIGGAQNTFGTAGASFGTDITVETGIGQSGPQIIISGSFAAPGTTGVYSYSLQNALANVIDVLGAPMTFSTVREATVDVSGGTISFTVGQALCRADSNCDGVVNFDDIDAFIAALIGETSWEELFLPGAPSCPFLSNDVSADSVVNFDDIDAFISALIEGVCA